MQRPSSFVAALGLVLAACALVSPASANGVTVTAGTVVGAPGTSVVVPISIGPVDDMAGFQLWVQYDAAQLGIVDANVTPGPALGALAGTFDGNATTTPGNVFMSWFDFNTGVDVAGSGVIANLTFFVKPGAVSPVVIDLKSGTPVSTPYPQVDFLKAPSAVPTLVDGAITFENGPAPDVVPEPTSLALLAVVALIAAPRAVRGARRRAARRT